MATNLELGIRLLIFALAVDCQLTAEVPFDGRYTLVNKLHGTRVFACPEAGFSLAQTNAPIHHDQMWKVIPQGDDKHTIENAANGLRMVAKSGADGDSDFFVIQGGPVYQDQKWLLQRQEDGSHAIINGKSNRRLLVQYDANGQPLIAAANVDGPVVSNQAWWIIDQEKDASAHLWPLLHEERLLGINIAAALHVCRDTEQALLAQIDKYSSELRLQQPYNTDCEINLQAAARQNDVCRANAFAASQNYSDIVTKFDLSVNHSHQLQLRLEACLSHEDDMRQQLLRGKQQIESLHSRLAAAIAQKNATFALHSQMKSEAEAMQALLSSLTSQAGVSRFLQWLACSATVIFLLSAAFSVWYTSRNSVQHCAENGLSSSHDPAELRPALVSRGNKVDGDVEPDRAQTGFCYQIISRIIDDESERLIRIQCPGVDHAGITLNLISNGCEVLIRRSVFFGAPPTTWRKTFQFQLSEGLFEFKEDQMQLEHGVLSLVFRAFAVQRRTIRFPCHFNLATSDGEPEWDYPDYDELYYNYEKVSWLEPVSAETQSTASTEKDVHSESNIGDASRSTQEA